MEKSYFRMLPLSSQFKPPEYLTASFRTELKFTGSVKSFLNFGRKTNSGIVWNWLWCCLDGKEIKCFAYPDHEEEGKTVEIIKLDTCTSEAVRIEIPRRTLLLEIMEDRKEQQMLTKIYLSAETVQEIAIWEENINSVINVLTKWKC